MDYIEYKEQLIYQLYHDAKPTLKISHDKSHISTTDYKFKLDNPFLTIKNYSDDIAKLKTDGLHINVDTTVNANKIFDLNLSTKIGLNDEHTKLDQHEMVQDRELNFHAKNNK